MLKFNSKPSPHLQPFSNSNTVSIHSRRMDWQLLINVSDNCKQQTHYSINKEDQKIGDARENKIDGIQINFKKILHSILPQFCLESMQQYDGVSQNTNELLMRNQKRQKKGKMHEIQIQMYRILQTLEINKSEHDQIVCRKSLTNTKWDCIDSIQVQNRYIMYAIGGQMVDAYSNADAVQISIIVYDKYTANFSIGVENAVSLQLEYEYNDYLRVDLNRRVYMVAIKWVNSNLVICALSNGCLVLVNVAELLTGNTQNVQVERLSISAITQIKILTHHINLTDRIMGHLSQRPECVLIVLTKDQQLFIVNILSNCADSRRRYAMIILHKYCTLLGTQMVTKYHELKQQRTRQTKYLTIIEQGSASGLKLVQGSRSGVIKIWVIPLSHLTYTNKTKQSKKQNDSQKQKKEEEMKHKEEEQTDIRSINLKMKQHIQNFIVMIKEDNQGKAYQRGTDTEMKDTDSSHGNQQMEIQLSLDNYNRIDNQIDINEHKNCQKLNYNHQSLISTYEQFTHRQKLHQNQSNQQGFVKAPALRYCINPTSIITSLFYDTQLLEMQSFGKFLIAITSNGFLTILAIDEDNCKRSQIQNEFRNNFFGQISEAYQIIMENKIFVSKKEDEKCYEQYVGMIRKKRNLYVMINKIRERRKKIQEVQCYIKIIKIDQKYRIKQIQVILLNTGGNLAINRNKISYFEIRESKIINDCYKMRHKKYQEGKKCKQTLSDVFVANFQNSYLQRYMNVVVQSEHIYYEEQTRKNINQRYMKELLKKQYQQYSKKYQINHWKITDQYLCTQP